MNLKTKILFVFWDVTLSDTSYVLFLSFLYRRPPETLDKPQIESDEIRHRIQNSDCYIAAYERLDVISKSVFLGDSVFGIHYK